MPYPIVLDLDRRDVLVVGGGNVAARKIPGLVEAGARVRCVSPAVVASVRQLHEAGEIVWQQRRFRTKDIQRASLVFAATNDADVNQRVLLEARRARVLANCAAGEDFDFALPAVSGRGDIGVATWTGVPALTVRLRDLVTNALDETWTRWERAARIVGELRDDLKQTEPDAKRRAALLRAAAAGAPDHFGSEEEAEAFVSEVMAETSS